MKVLYKSLKSAWILLILACMNPVEHAISTKILSTHISEKNLVATNVYCSLFSFFTILTVITNMCKHFYTGFIFLTKKSPVLLILIGKPVKEYIVRQCIPKWDTALSWVKVFRIIPEFRILRLTFHRKSASKYWIGEDYNGFSGLLSVYLKTAVHLNLKLSIFCRDTASKD